MEKIIILEKYKYIKIKKLKKFKEIIKILKNRNGVEYKTFKMTKK